MISYQNKCIYQNIQVYPKKVGNRNQSQIKVKNLIKSIQKKWLSNGKYNNILKMLHLIQFSNWKERNNFN
jgi:hypothetical protein